MTSQRFPFAVRLIGFSSGEEAGFDVACESALPKRYEYFRLDDGNLQDPDMYLVNANNPRALVALSSLNPGPVRPALLLGACRFDLPFPCLEGSIASPGLFRALDKLVEERADALSRLQASDIVIVPERRRRVRLEMGDPARYKHMRAKRPERGAILVVDRTTAFRDYLAELLSRFNVPVLWAATEDEGMEACRRQTVAITIINTSTPDLDPYRLCWALKEKDDMKVTVVMLVSEARDYNVVQASYVGADGYLIKPVLPQHLISAIKKFMPLR